MNKDVLYTIYEIVHRDLTKRLNAEYISKVLPTGAFINQCFCYNICRCYITIKYSRPYTYFKAYNYRLSIHRWMIINTKYGKKRCRVSKNH